MCGTALWKDVISVPVRDEMAAAMCLPGFHMNKAQAGDAILRVILHTLVALHRAHGLSS